MRKQQQLLDVWATQSGNRSSTRLRPGLHHLVPLHRNPYCYHTFIWLLCWWHLTVLSFPLLLTLRWRHAPLLTWKIQNGCHLKVNLDETELVFLQGKGWLGWDLSGHHWHYCGSVHSDSTELGCKCELGWPCSHWHEPWMIAFIWMVALAKQQQKSWNRFWTLTEMQYHHQIAALAKVVVRPGQSHPINLRQPNHSHLSPPTKTHLLRLHLSNLS